MCVLKNVSRETSNALDRYVDLLRKWTSKINLISASTLSEIQHRHIEDSAQIFDIDVPSQGTWLDLGSGGGLPGLVISILAREKRPRLKVELVESDLRKATFLRTVIRELELDALVHTKRVESLSPIGATVVSARAMAPLTDLLGYAHRHLKMGGVGIFPKGETWEKEVESARESWSFELETYKSKTDPRAAILKIGDIQRVRG